VRASIDLNVFPVILTDVSYRYFKAANPSSVGRNIFSLPLPLDSNLKFIDAAPTPKLTPLTGMSSLGKYEANFSPQAGFYLLSYDGPNIPWQRAIKANDTSAGL
jgi:dipeptidyl aminopeptidase B